MSSGRLWRKLGPATEKAWVPTVDNLTGGMWRRFVPKSDIYWLDVFRPHRVHAVHAIGCGLLLQMSQVAWSVCVCWSHRCALRCLAKTIEMLFAWLTPVGPNRAIHMAVEIAPTGRGSFWGCPAHWKAMSVTLLAGEQAGRRARGRLGGRHCTASQYGYVPLGRHPVTLALSGKHNVTVCRSSVGPSVCLFRRHSHRVSPVGQHAPRPAYNYFSMTIRRIDIIYW